MVGKTFAIIPAMISLVRSYIKKEYTEIFGDKFKILTKCSDFTDANKPSFKEPNSVLKMVYAGNISVGRYEILAELDPDREPLPRDVIEQVDIEIKYEGYMARQLRQIEQFKKMEKKRIFP